jgi:heat-inducible transcriptional repressor
MNDRQKKVLASIVDLYSRTALPVGSQALLEAFRFPVSSATLRHDMVVLEEEGYLYQPHTSAGRIPTDQGYRFYVEEEMRDEELSREDQILLKKELLMRRAKEARMSRTVAKLLSSVSGSFAVSGSAQGDGFFDFGMKELIENPEFHELDDVCRLVEALDLIDEKFEVLIGKLKDDETRIYIGSENPIEGLPENCSMLVSPYRDKAGERGLLAIIGPKRMPYAKNKSLLEYMKKLLSSSAVVIVLLNGCMVVLSSRV